MFSGNAQIVQMYEELDLSPGEIAETLEIDEQAVHLTLASNSVKFRKEKAIEKAGNDSSYAQVNADLFTKGDVDEAAAVIANLCKFSEDEHIQMRAANFIINEAKGRHDLKHIKNLNLNVTLINDQMKRAREAKERAKSKVIDVPA